MFYDVWVCVCDTTALMSGCGCGDKKADRRILRPVFRLLSIFSLPALTLSVCRRGLVCVSITPPQTPPSLTSPTILLCTLFCSSVKE